MDICLAAPADLPLLHRVIEHAYRGDEARFHELVAEWPRDIAAYSTQLAFPTSTLMGHTP
jgi:hypothetical protein